MPTANSLFSVFLALALWPSVISATPINIAVDIDSLFTSPDFSGIRHVTTQPGFLSWIASDANPFLTTQFATQGVTFELQAYRELFGGIASSFARSFDRMDGGGGPYDNLLQDFVYSEGTSDFLRLKVSGLPVGSYRMATWHYDAGLFVDPFDKYTDYMQIDVGDLQGTMVAAATTTVVDLFPFGTSPQVFEFQITSPTVAKEIIFRPDNPSFGPGVIPAHRTRLNGFTLASVPEQCTFLPFATGLSIQLLYIRRAKLHLCRDGNASNGRLRHRPER